MGSTGFVVLGLGFTASGLGFRVQGFGFRVQVFRVMYLEVRGKYDLLLAVSIPKS